MENLVKDSEFTVVDENALVGSQVTLLIGGPAELDQLLILEERLRRTVAGKGLRKGSVYRVRR